jgi:hypothetical protein
MTEYTLEASVKLEMIEYALVASVDPCGSLLAEGIAECHYTGPQPVTIISVGEGIKINPGKIKAIKKWKAPCGF